jgi:hypothetical protein
VSLTVKESGVESETSDHKAWSVSAMLSEDEQLEFKDDSSVGVGAG